MSDVLLRELSNSDIDWMVANGQRLEIAAETILVQPKEPLESIYLLLSGTLSLGISAEDLGDRQEITRLTQGEIVGEAPIFDTPSLAEIRAVEDSLVLAIPRQTLLEKLRHDIQFSAHFYRAIALIMAERLRQLLEMPGQIQDASSHPGQDALLIFGEFRDSDIDWMTMMGRVEKVPSGYLLIQAGKPIDALHIVLDGVFTVLVTDGDYNSLTLCFECAEKTASTMRPIANLTRGEMAGTISFLDFRLPPITIRAARESLVLSIPRQQMTTHLQNNKGFAARFYRVLAMQLSHSLQSVLSRLGCSGSSFDARQHMDEALDYEDELDLDELHHVSQGAARFNWMMKRLGVGSSMA
ncbi:MAG TPA: cyclic nucleotide-binding domain-containing protein [Elainellaceae cyanobacterium]